RSPTRRDQKLHVRKSQSHIVKCGTSGIAAKTISPGTGDGNVVVLSGPTKLCTRQSLLHGCQPVLKSPKVSTNDPDGSLIDLGRARRKMNLLFAAIRPHVAQTNVQLGTPRKAHTHDLDHQRDRLIRPLNIYVVE